MYVVWHYECRRCAKCAIVSFSDYSYLFRWFFFVCVESSFASVCDAAPMIGEEMKTPQTVIKYVWCIFSPVSLCVRCSSKWHYPVQCARSKNTRKKGTRNSIRHNKFIQMIGRTNNTHTHTPLRKRMTAIYFAYTFL